MGSDVPLSAAGKERAQALLGLLADKGIDTILSTGYDRTRSTADPLARSLGKHIGIYDPRDSGFAKRIRTYEKGNVLIVGHSNTVDDIVNGILGEKVLSDLPETEYGDLFVVRRRNGKFSFSRSRFGK
jgi:2,3-bisphosphoglycerate-dependent phosphoglycerate mutase